MCVFLPPNVFDTPIVCDLRCPHQVHDPSLTSIIPNPCNWPTAEPFVENIRGPVRKKSQLNQFYALVRNFHPVSRIIIIEMLALCVNILAQMIDANNGSRIEIDEHNG